MTSSGKSVAQMFVSNVRGLSVNKQSEHHLVNIWCSDGNPSIGGAVSPRTPASTVPADPPDPDYTRLYYTILDYTRLY